MYHFLAGYTSKLAGTERGITTPTATFSECFGSPFMPLHASEYATLLGEKLEQHQTRVYMINTGWTGGAYGIGKRMDISYTRAMVSAALSGLLDNVQYRHDDIFNVYVPVSVPNVPSDVLDPRNTWADPSKYQETATSLAKMFVKNFEKFGDKVSSAVVEAGPKLN
jgi:phosphoenolpyruvate carboxykinase (ATP)